MLEERREERESEQKKLWGEKEGGNELKMTLQREEGGWDRSTIFTPALSMEFHPSSKFLSSDVVSGTVWQLSNTKVHPASKARVITPVMKHSWKNRVVERGEGGDVQMELHE